MSLKYSYVPDPFGVHHKVIEAVPPGSSVLDIGCASGYLAKAFRGKGCTVDAVEIDKKDAEPAKKFCRKLVIGDIEDRKILKQLDTQYDVIVLADVLEHLRNPEDTLSRMRDRLKSDGIIAITIPNIAFLTNRLYHLFGRFDYTETGIMDKTHFRFFTRKTLNALIHNAQLRMVQFDYAGNFTQLPFYMRTLHPLFGQKIWWKRIEHKLTGLWPEGLAIQFFLICRR